MATTSGTAGAALSWVDAHVPAEYASYLPDSYWVVLVAGLIGLIGMMVGETKKNWLALGAALAWGTIFVTEPYTQAEDALRMTIWSTGELVFFLLFMMTIIEGGVHYGMMNAILRLINTNSKRVLMLIIGVMSFMLSAVLDNLTAAIVMGVLITQLMQNPLNRAMFAMVVIAGANAGGVASAIGNTTSILLWVGGQLTIDTMFIQLIMPSIVYLLVIFICLWPFLGGKVERPIPDELNLTEGESFDLSPAGQWGILFFVLTCIGLMIGLKVVLHIPPVVGALAAFGVWSTVTWRINRAKGKHFLAERDVRSALKHIDMATILMFTAMLPLVAAVGHKGILSDLADLLMAYSTQMFGPESADISVAVEMGLISSAVPNTPLVAASQVMFDHPTNHQFWIVLNYTTGVGGAILPFGSAAGVVLMSKFRNELTLGLFVKILTLPALAAFFAGLGVIYLQQMYLFS